MSVQIDVELIRKLLENDKDVLIRRKWNKDHYEYVLYQIEPKKVVADERKRK